jgi:hypothetical protein
MLASRSPIWYLCQNFAIIALDLCHDLSNENFIHFTRAMDKEWNVFFYLRRHAKTRRNEHKNPLVSPYFNKLASH